jgi:hypothetical protein
MERQGQRPVARPAATLECDRAKAAAPRWLEIPSEARPQVILDI